MGLTKDALRQLWSNILTTLDTKVDKVDGKRLSTNDFTNEDKSKLDSLANPIVDNELSDSSTNPVQNKIINEALNSKASITDLTSHIDDKANPHEVSLSQLGITATATEVNYTVGATSNIQEQLNVLASRIFVGTHAQYDVAYAAGQIPINCIVIFTDDEEGGSSGGDTPGGDTPGGGDEPTSSTTAMLGYAVLGQMVLG
jgi:hypothetical protein